MSKRVVVIGAGVSGLSAGCYAAMNGYDVEVHESHERAGGLCTAWKRGDFIIDNCVHWLIGTRPGSEMYRAWEEVGVFPASPLLHHEVFARFLGRDGRTLSWYTHSERLEEHLNSLAPGDHVAIRELCALIRKLGSLPVPVGKAAELRNIFDNVRLVVRMAPYLGAFSKVSDLTLGELSQRFHDPLLRAAIAGFLNDPAMPALVLPLTLGPMGQGDAGYPLGGSIKVAETLEKRLLDLGGRIVFQSKVAQVLESKGAARGVRLESGAEVPADFVIAACDLRRALYELLDGSRVDPYHRELLETGHCYNPLIVANFGYAGLLPDEPSCVGTFHELEAPIELAGSLKSVFGVKSSAYDPSLAPPGKCIVSSSATTDWSIWDRLRADPEGYQAAKQRFSDTCLREMEKRVPGFGMRVEVKDVATPLTFERYTGNDQGRFMTWILSGADQREHPYVPKTVPGLSGFFIASMWTNPPGGISGGVVVGRAAGELICHEDRKHFETSCPS